MKVLDLQCQHQHSFEGWFGSEDDFQSQLARGLVECPLCGDARVTKKLSAPRLNLSGSRELAPVQNQNATNFVAANGQATGTMGQNRPKEQMLQTMLQDPQFQAAYLHMARRVLADTEDVGSQFASEARKIHYGEAKERSIRGQASQDETLELLDEGIDVLPLPLPAVLKETLQ
ncbi:MAG: DUF1178 family protein [Burkholderiaceae bacterium]